MNNKASVKIDRISNIISGLLDQDIQDIAVLIRHSERHYTKVAELEPFMTLTEIGKEYAVSFGEKLGKNPIPRLYSSFFGRCIETAYLIDKGFSNHNGGMLANPVSDQMLAPFYILDIQKVVDEIVKHGSPAFIRRWFNGQIDETIIEKPDQTAQTICNYMIEHLQNQQKNEITICISHDWNIFPVKEFELNMPHEKYGDIDYLDGMIFYRDQDGVYVTCHLSEPKQIQ
ncbi:MAG: histidine phosphatase family protein [Desulfobacteraceae bacterium]|nr:histidine phosphatase family protein [Desulfobacteraceae bacterium]